MTSDSSSLPSEPQTRARVRRGPWPFIRDILVILIIAILVSFLVKTFLVRSFYIPSGSMENTLLKDDRILVDELTPRFGGYDRGDVVVFRDPGGWLPVSYEPAQPPLAAALDWVTSLVGLTASDSEEHLIKRIIGVPGDHVVCCNALGQVTVNDVPLNETPYLKLGEGQQAPQEVEFDVTVPEDSIWVLGDNRDSSQDSRYHQDQPGRGFVPMENIVGRAFIKTWPLDRIGGIDGHHDVFSSVPAREPQ
ncbi:signal peptidase I [Microbacterium dauci]|uniref:Signal peptidase I n=1 Tax=Microbacterium dauci TaxID=3048008 RepID=A0ABT6ZCH2_9MICO|nr:signal peptidase I [Microbacterium sp. LX3-4]MDJ1113638.1 signal peptidase I [Microbacterium sp. LX3-4]